jgi:hypothetical protein
MEIREEQLVYAKWLEHGMRVGFLLLVFSFLNYIFGIFSEPHINLEHFSRYWSLSAEEFNKVTNSPTGWNWILYAGKSDYMNFFGILILSLITVVCYLRIIPIFLKKSDYLYLAIAVLEVFILILAASGILNSGH